MAHFPLVKKGYDPEAVDQHITILYQELREYREKDASITKAILNAQLAADEIIRKADVAAETIIRNARGRAARLSESSGGQIMDIIDAVRKQRERLIEFKLDYTALLEKYIHTIDESDITNAENKSWELEKYLQKFVDSELHDLLDKDGNPSASE